MPKPANLKSTRKPSKIYTVPLGQMRTPPALVTQREFRKSHGDSICASLDLDKLGYPILNHRDGAYWVVDGQHRIYALKKYGFNDADVVACEVYENLTDAEMAEIFLGRDDRRAIPAFDKFHVACTANHVRESTVRRAIESQGVRISRSKEEHTIGAIGAACNVYDLAGGERTGEIVVGQVVRTLDRAYSGDPFAFEAHIVRGLGMLYNRYNGKTDEKDLIASLAARAGGVRALMQRAEKLRLMTGSQMSHCVAAAAVEVYNRGRHARGAERLPGWFKDRPEGD